MFSPPRSLRALVPLLSLSLLLLVGQGAAPPTITARGPAQPGGLIAAGDRVAFVGSSSTRIGIWPRTVEFLLRTRHPELNLEFRRFTTGDGTFQTGLSHIEGWLGEFDPTVVIFNYGGNDAAEGEAGLPKFRERMSACVAHVQARGARVILVTPQAADLRRSGRDAAARRTLYAETMLSYGRSQGWSVIDVHHPLDALQRGQQARESTFTILRDSIHLTAPSYVAWGYYFYDRLDLPFVRSAATLNAEGAVLSTDHCTIRDVEAGPEGLKFTRTDIVLPILPPDALPPREFVPLENLSRYMLTITGLAQGEYEVRCEGQLVGRASQGELAAGVNLNSLLLDAKQQAPWEPLARRIWEGRELHRIGTTPWRFVVQRRPAAAAPAE